jgi:hypothetical protein
MQAIITDDYFFTEHFYLPGDVTPNSARLARSPLFA